MPPYYYLHFGILMKNRFRDRIHPEYGKFTYSEVIVVLLARLCCPSKLARMFIIYLDTPLSSKIERIIIMPAAAPTT